MGYLFFIHCQCASLGVLEDFEGLLLEPLLFLGLGGEGDAMGSGVMVLIQIGEGGETIGGGLLWLTAAVHLGVDGEGAASRVDHLALEGDDVAGKDGKLKVDAMQHEQNRVLGVDILCHGKIGALQKPLGTSSCKKGLMVVEIGEFDQAL